ncbi:golgin subfamily A member 6-like protein 22 [Neodiprion pinetum]|uniref:golgin subfamily A member 6-like protein 22 n=1 Tax=Neodiprion pinetum TaxID=441929 RepID=UPI00371D9442
MEERILKKSNLTQSSPEEKKTEGNKKKAQQPVVDKSTNAKTEEGETATDCIKKTIMNFKEELMGEMRKKRIEEEKWRGEVKQEVEKLTLAIESTKKEWTQERSKLEETIVRLEREHVNWKIMEQKKREDGMKYVDRQMDELFKKIKVSGVLEGSMLDAEKNWEAQEKWERRNNVMIRGLEVDVGGRADRLAERLLAEVTGELINIKEVQVFQEGRNRALLVKLGDWVTKRKVMDGKSVLKGRKVFIDDDLTKREKEIQIEITKRATEARASGMRVKIGYMKLWVEDSMYVWSEEEKGLKEVRTGRRLDAKGNRGSRDLGQRLDDGREDGMRKIRGPWGQRFE